MMTLAFLLTLTHLLRYVAVAVVLVALAVFTLRRVGWWRRLTDVEVRLAQVLGQRAARGGERALLSLAWSWDRLPPGVRWWLADALSRVCSAAYDTASAWTATARRRWRRYVQPPLDALYAWLDRWVFPPVVAYFSHPLHITALIVLGVALAADHDTTLQLLGGNYLNLGSCLTAIILLYRQQQAERRQAVAHAELHARHDAHDERLDAHGATLAQVQADVARLLALVEAGVRATPPDDAPDAQP